MFHSTIFEVWDQLPKNGRVAIDILIGAPIEGVLPCDRDAKIALGHRGNSIFYTPTRKAVYASNIDEAKNGQSDLDFSIQNQAWAIVPRIREVDNLLRIHLAYTDEKQIIETQPEVALVALLLTRDGRGNPTYVRSRHPSQMVDMVHVDPFVMLQTPEVLGQD